MAKYELETTVKTPLKDKIAYPFKAAWNAVKNFFYDIGVSLHNAFAKITGADKRVKDANPKHKRIGEAVFVWIILLYPLLQFTIFYIGTNINSIALCFQEYFREDIIENGAVVGVTNGFKLLPFDRLFENFEKFFDKFANDSNIGLYFRNAIIQYLWCLVMGLTFNIVFAYVLFKKIPATGFFQVILYLPNIISNVVVSMMFSKFIGDSFPNLCEYVLGIKGVPIDLLYNEKTVLFINLFYILWVGFGSQLILYSGAMSRIPDSIIEFGELEGITMLKELWYVVIPMIFSTITVFLVTGIPGIFAGQMALYNFYGNYAPNSAITIGYYFYIIVLGDATSSMPQYPYASAAGIVFTLVSAPLTLTARHFLEKYGPNVEF